MAELNQSCSKCRRDILPKYKAKVITRGNCMMCGKELDEGLFFCKDCEAKAESEEKMANKEIDLVIRIDEEYYNDLKSLPLLPFSTYPEEIIYKGVPLPKGHGDLKDTEKLKNAFIAWSMVVQGNFTNTDIASIICNSPTIIEADKESEGVNDKSIL